MKIQEKKRKDFEYNRTLNQTVKSGANAWVFMERWADGMEVLIESHGATIENIADAELRSVALDILTHNQVNAFELPETIYWSAKMLGKFWEHADEFIAWIKKNDEHDVKEAKVLAAKRKELDDAKSDEEKKKEEPCDCVACILKKALTGSFRVEVTRYNIGGDTPDAGEKTE